MIRLTGRQAEKQADRRARRKVEIDRPRHRQTDTASQTGRQTAKHTDRRRKLESVQGGVVSGFSVEQVRMWE